MTNLDKNSRFLLIMICIITFLLILIFAINYFSERQNRIQSKNRKKLIKEINKAAKTIVPEVKQVPKKKEISPVTQSISVQQEPEEIIEDDEEEVIEILQDDNESDVDRILKEIKKASKEDNMNLTEFEKEQEETAIISYDELCKRAGVKKKVYKAVTEATMDVSKIVPDINNEKKKYKPTQYVSPIFGVEKQKVKEQNEDLDKTFLQNLKDFRSTLDM
jgi:preprotein translocase subunit YajC